MARKTPTAEPRPPTPPATQAVRLKKPRHVCNEIARTYRAFKSGEIDASTAKTRGFLLQVLASVIRDEKLGEIETQIAELKRLGVIK